MGKGTDTRTINGRKVVFMKFVWSCESCGRAGVVRVPGRASAEAPYRMVGEDHDTLNRLTDGEVCGGFKGTVGVPEKW